MALAQSIHHGSRSIDSSSSSLPRLFFSVSRFSKSEEYAFYFLVVGAAIWASSNFMLDVDWRETDDKDEDKVGPLRCWPGGLCLSRSIGDTDVGEFIVPIPHVKQVKLSNVGGRLIIASDGIWDSLSSEMAAKACRGLPAEIAAKLVVKEALRASGLKDDTTCLVVDIVPTDHSVFPSSPMKNQNKLRSLFLSLRSPNSVNKHMRKLSSVGSVEELFEEGSAMLEERLVTNFPSKANSSPFRCAICQTDQAPNEELSLPAPNLWEGPYLCSECRRKKEAMEGKRPSRSTR